MGQERADELYEQATREFGGSLTRLVRGYEADEEKRRDLSQEVHFQLWRSLAVFDGRCSLRTWVFRVAHNAAASYVGRQSRDAARKRRLVSLEEIELRPPSTRPSPEAALDRARQVELLAALMRELKPLDRQVMHGYLEEMDARSIGEITGLSPAAVAMKIHRVKLVLSARLQDGATASS